MKKLTLLGLILWTATALADTPPQIINKQCSANQYFSQIQPGAGNINCTQPTYSGLANLPNFIDSISYTSNNVMLVNDSNSPGASELYGTNALGSKGFFSIPVIGVGTSNGLSISSQLLSLGLSSSTTTGALSSTDWNTFNNKQASGSYLTALTGDGTAAGPGSSALTLATVNLNVGSFGSSTAIPNFTVNGKGLITAAGTSVVIAPAGTLSGTTLNSTVVSSSLTSVGTIGTGVWQGTAIGDSYIATPYIKADGTRALTGNWAAGAFSATHNSVVVGSAANTVSGLSTIVNTGTLTLPTSTDTIVGRATTDTLTNKSISGSGNTFSNIPNSATTATNANTASAIVSRDGSGNFTAGTITAALTGHASSDLALTGGTLTGAFTVEGDGTNIGFNVNSSNLIQIGTAVSSTNLTTLFGTQLIRSDSSGFTNLEIDNQNTSGSTGFFLRSGNGTTSGQYAYTLYQNRQTSAVQWFTGTFGSNSYTIAEGSSSSTASGVPYIVVTTAGQITLGQASGTQQIALNNLTATPASGVGTFTNLPTGYSGNPAGYLQFTINGTTHIMPYF